MARSVCAPPPATMTTRWWGPSAHSTLTNLSELAEVLYHSGKLGEAEVVLRRVMAGFEATLGLGSPQTLSSSESLATCLGLAEVLVVLQRPVEAAPIFARVLSTLTGVLGAAHPATIQFAQQASANRDAIDRLNNHSEASSVGA